VYGQESGALRVWLGAAVKASYIAGPCPLPTAPVIVAALAMAAQRTGCPLELLTAVAYHESGYNPDAVASSGRRGLMLLCPRVCAFLRIDPFNPVQSAEAVGLYLVHWRGQFRGSWAHAVAAWTWDQSAGSDYVRSAPELDSWPVHVRAYVGRVLGSAGYELPFTVDLLHVRGGK
jgi:Transglycosylase SLT domain